MKAVIPAAGLGTRFLPATKNTPKEMLPVLSKPAIQYVVEEAVASGIDDILIVTGRGKRAIEDHFDVAPEVEAFLALHGDVDRLAEIRRISDLADIHFIRQKEPRGLGHAILQARKHVDGEPFAVLLGDDLVFSSVPCTRQLVERFERHQAPMIAVERVTRDKVSSYGIVDPGPEVEPGVRRIEDLVEKPRPEDAPSDLGILGRYVLTPEIFDCIERTPPGHAGEVQLTDALRLMRADQPLYAVSFEGRRYDLGSPLEWLKTNIDVALMRPDLRDAVLEHLQRRVKAPEAVGVEEGEAWHGPS